jgi:hypothetical protein
MAKRTSNSKKSVRAAKGGGRSPKTSQPPRLDQPKALLKATITEPMLTSPAACIVVETAWSTAVPASLQRHALVQDRYFYTLPATLWECVEASIGRGRFNPSNSSVEAQLGKISGDHSARVGYFRGQPVSFNRLRPLPKLAGLAKELAKLMPERREQNLEHHLSIAQSPTDRIAKVTRAYLGWLLTNRTFLEEHDQLFRDWHTLIGQLGIQSLGLSLPVEMVAPAARRDWEPCNVAFQAFYARWRLMGLAGPYLPIPLQPMMAGVVPKFMLQRLSEAGGLFSIPDTFPIFSRDELRGLLIGAQHGEQEQTHLTEWMKLTAGNNMSKQKLGMFERLWETQHYWRILQGRHHQGLHRMVTQAKSTLATFLQVTPRRIHLDLIEISKRLGAKWYERSWGEPWGPFDDRPRKLSSVAVN